MTHNNTIFKQILKIVPRHEFESLAQKHHSGAALRKMTRWGQFVAMTSAQLSGRVSLRDVVSNLSAQMNKLYHLGCKPVSRSSLARVNKEQPASLYEELFYILYQRCKQHAPNHRFRFKNKLLSLDATTVNLALSAFPWSDCNQQIKGAIKIHVGLDHDGYIPAFVSVGDGRSQERQISKTLALPQNSIVVFDLGYTNLAWFEQLTENNVFLSQTPQTD